MVAATLRGTERHIGGDGKGYLFRIVTDKIYICIIYAEGFTAVVRCRVDSIVSSNFNLSQVFIFCILGQMIVSEPTAFQKKRKKKEKGQT